MHFIPVETHYCQQENSVHIQNKREIITIEIEKLLSQKDCLKQNKKATSCIITDTRMYTVKKSILLAGKAQCNSLNPHLSEISVKLRN